MVLEGTEFYFVRSEEEPLVAAIRHAYAEILETLYAFSVSGKEWEQPGIKPLIAFREHMAASLPAI